MKFTEQQIVRIALSGEDVALGSYRRSSERKNDFRRRAPLVSTAWMSRTDVGDTTADEKLDVFSLVEETSVGDSC